MRALWLCSLVVALATGCTTFAPPLRSTHYGAPGRVDQGDIELGGATGAPGFAPLYGGPRLGYGLRDWVSIEAGGDFARDGWALGYGGARLTLNPDRERKIHGAADLELGLGLGVGGETEAGDGRSWSERLAFGGYLGAGGGVHIAWFSLFGRGRVQSTAADGIPWTFWWSAVGGLQFALGRYVDLYGAVGAAGFHAYEWGSGLIYDFGLMIHFDVAETHRRLRARREARKTSR